MMEEVWKDIEGYEGKYQVSNLGRVPTIGEGFHPCRHQMGATYKVAHHRDIDYHFHFYINILNIQDYDKRRV